MLARACVYRREGGGGSSEEISYIIFPSAGISPLLFSVVLVYLGML